MSNKNYDQISTMFEGMLTGVIVCAVGRRVRLCSCDMLYGDCEPVKSSAPMCSTVTGACMNLQ